MEGKDGEGGKEANVIVPSLFLHSMVRTLGCPSRSAAKNGEGYYSNTEKYQSTPSCYDKISSNLEPYVSHTSLTFMFINCCFVLLLYCNCCIVAKLITLELSRD
jgi:hypothetical protein